MKTDWTNMIKMALLLYLAATAMELPLTSISLADEKNTVAKPAIYTGMSLKGLVPSESLQQKLWLNAVKRMLTSESITMQTDVINKILTTLQCANQYNVDHTPILTVIDFSLPSNQKRLWVFDLDNKKLLFNTYVSHGIKSGFLKSNYFSNQHNSKASSLGVFRTDHTYYGRYGLGLRLTGLESGFNHHASRRAIVMHAGWYVDERFIKKYGRAGRSWGCPSLPPDITKPLLNTIKEDGLLIAYYPSEKWLSKSKYLQCDSASNQPSARLIDVLGQEPEENRQPILFIEKNNNNQYDQNEPILAISADQYVQTFNTTAPLKRMIRRQIDNKEYIALNQEEFKRLYAENNSLQAVSFIIPRVKRAGGRYVGTYMEKISLGQIKHVNFDEDKAANQVEYTMHFQNAPTRQIKSTEQFIRWLGL